MTYSISIFVRYHLNKMEFVSSTNGIPNWHFQHQFGISFDTSLGNLCNATYSFCCCNFFWHYTAFIMTIDMIRHVLNELWTHRRYKYSRTTAKYDFVAQLCAPPIWKNFRREKGRNSLAIQIDLLLTNWIIIYENWYFLFIFSLCEANAKLQISFQ